MTRHAAPAALAAAWLAAAPAWAGQDPAAVDAAIRQSLAPTLPQGAAVTLGNIAGASVMPSCAAPLGVTLSGVEPYQNAVVRCPSPAWTLYVPVTVAATEPVVVAARPVAAGQALGPDDLAVRREPEAAYLGQPVFYDPAALAGAVATMNLPAGAILTGSDVQAPLVVKAGQTVTVNVQSGGVDVAINAVADEPGRVGDTILLTNPGSGKRFSAVVTANGPVVVLQP
jgi:flagella basal body P-ring formation protein FlgA